MGNNEGGKPSKSEKSSSPAPPEQSNVPVYTDWAAMQGYYGPRMNIPPYYNPAVAPGHAPHPYMWPPPQAMMPPYGAPYAAIYPHGGVYAHPAVPFAATPLNVDTPTKSTGSTDWGRQKKLKGFDGLAMSIGNGNTERAEDGAEHGQSQSEETEGSSEGSDGNTSGADQAMKKRNREGSSTAGLTSASELRSPRNMNAKTVPKLVPQNCAVMNPESWIQNERDLKRERRKQSNRESARRSRLRKQAETEELAKRVETLTSENIALKSERNRLMENLETLKTKNATLTEKLKDVEVVQTEGPILNKADEKRAQPVSTENFLSRIENSSSIDRKAEERGERYEKTTNSDAKLHQLLDTNARADAVAAS